MELEKYRNDQEVSQSFLVNMEAPDVTENHRDYNVRKSLKCSKRASQVENVLSVILCSVTAGFATCRVRNVRVRYMFSTA